MNKIHGKSVLLGIGLGVILTALLGLIFTLGYTPDRNYAGSGNQNIRRAKAGTSTGKIPIEITKEDTLTDVSKKLSEKGIIADAVTFQIKVVNRNIKDHIVPGVYEFDGDEDEEEVIRLLTELENE